MPRSLANGPGICATKKLELHVVDYQKTPLAFDQLSALHKQLDCTVGEMLRENEPKFATLNLAEASDHARLQAVALHPILLQRPIVDYCGKAVIGRPTENLGRFLAQAAFEEIN